MAKFCTNCGNELPENAAMCVKCGKMVDEGKKTNGNNSGKKKGLPAWAIVLIVLGSVVVVGIIIVTIFAAIGFNTYKSNVGDIDDMNDIFNDNERLTGTIDDTLRGDDLNITLNDALMYSSVGEGYLVNKPEDGNEFLVFFFEIENKDDEAQYLAYTNFDGYVDGYKADKKYFLTDIEGTKQLSTTLSPGMKTKGYVAFEVDTSWQEFEIHFNESDYDDDDEYIFKVVNPDAE